MTRKTKLPLLAAYILDCSQRYVTTLSSKNNSKSWCEFKSIDIVLFEFFFFFFFFCTIGADQLEYLFYLIFEAEDLEKL